MVGAGYSGGWFRRGHARSFNPKSIIGTEKGRINANNQTTLPPITGIAATAETIAVTASQVPAKRGHQNARIDAGSRDIGPVTRNTIIQLTQAPEP